VQKKHDNVLATYRVWINPAGLAMNGRVVEITITLPSRVADATFEHDATIRMLLQASLTNNYCQPRLLSGQARAMRVKSFQRIDERRQIGTEYRRELARITRRHVMLMQGYTRETAERKTNSEGSE
jgi:hypothetical protein